MKKTLIVLCLLLPLTSIAYGRNHKGNSWAQRGNQPVTLTPTPSPIYNPQPTLPPTPSIPTPSPSPAPTSVDLVLGAFNANVGTVAVSFIGWKDQLNCVIGKTNFIYWENYGITLDSIINGSQDSVINSLKLCPDTIISLFHEMNGNWDSWDGTVGNNTSTKVVQAYQHVHNLIGNKVRWAWVINNDNVPNNINNLPFNYYPGDNYVDIVGVDGFDWGGLSFAQAISPNYAVVKPYGKPIWITSTGTANNSKQAAWVTDAISYSKANGIQGLLYFSLKDKVDFSLNAQSLASF